MCIRDSSHCHVHTVVYNSMSTTCWPHLFSHCHVHSVVYSNMSTTCWLNFVHHCRVHIVVYNNMSTAYWVGVHLVPHWHVHIVSTTCWLHLLSHRNVHIVSSTICWLHLLPHCHVHMVVYNNMSTACWLISSPTVHILVYMLTTSPLLLSCSHCRLQQYVYNFIDYVCSPTVMSVLRIRRVQFSFLLF